MLSIERRSAAIGVCLLVGLFAGVSAQAQPRLAWDESSTSNVQGYAISIDGTRTDYGLTPAGSGGACGCSIPLPFSGGAHSIVVSAYNAAGEVAAPAINVGPQAAPGGPYAAQVGTSLSVTGAASVDTSAGTLTSYQWQWGDGTTASKSSSATASHTYGAAGTFTLTLTVTDNAGATSSASTTVTVTNVAPPPTSLPSPWQRTDIGSVGAAGSASYANSTFSVSGAGADIWGTSDSFDYVYQPLAGDGQIVARVVSMTNTNTYAKAGVMIRETVAGNSSFVMLDLEPAGGIEFMQRNGTGASAALVAGSTDAPPAWLKLTRSGNTIAAAISSDGSSWSQVGSTSVTMGSSVSVGLVVCSHVSGVLNTAVFDHVAFTAGGVTSAPAAPSSPSPSNGATGVSVTPTLSWTASGATNYDVRFGTANPPPQVTTAQTAASFAPGSLAANTTYYWQIVAHNSAGATTGAVWSFKTGGAVSTGVPAPWVSQDVGAVSMSGSATASSGAFTLTGSGADIWGTADAFQYVYQPLAGDGQISARVNSLQNTNTYAKAGLMLRASTGAGAVHVILDTRPDGSIEFMTRTTSGGTTTFIAGASQTLPAWLKLVRSGSNVTGYVSRDGAAWTQVGSTAVSALPSSALAGLVVTSHDVSQSATAAFDSVAVSASSGSTAPSSNGDIVIYSSDASASSIHGAWSQTASSSSPGGTMLATSDTGVSHANAPLASPSDYVDLTFSANAGTPYRIWVRLRALNNSKYNDSLWVQFSDARANGSSVYAMNTTAGLLVNLATDRSGSSLSGWGWENGAYWLSQATTLTFATSGMHTIRVQVREDGVEFDQIVLSPSEYLSAPPGPAANDNTIVPR